MSEQGRCRSCGAPIIWAKTVNGKAMPLDAEPSLKGNLFLDAEGVATLVVRGTAVLEGHPLYLSHFMSCPNAKQHRKA